MRDAKVIVVTGASAGVGRAIVRELASPGVSLGLLARGEDGLRGAAGEVERAGGRALVLPTDTSDATAVEEAARRVEEELGPIDVWINDAMVTVFSPVKQLTPEDVRRVTEVTYLGYVNGTLAALKRMLPRDRGVIVQIGSALAYRAIPLQAAYCAAKHAIKGFTEALRVELTHDGSRVKVVELVLPAHNTPQFDWAKSRVAHRAQPVPPIFQPEVTARAVRDAIRRPRPVIFVGWPAVTSAWAGRVARPLADLYLARKGYGAQQTGERRPDRPHNLWDPLPGDHGAHGRFDARSRRVSLQYELSRRKRMLLGGAAALGVAALAIRAVR